MRVKNGFYMFTFAAFSALSPPCLKQDHVLAHRRTSFQGYQSLEQFHMLMTAKDFHTGVLHCPPVKTISR